MSTQYVSVYLRGRTNSPTVFLRRFRYETGGNFITFREMIMVNCPEIRRRNWQMHWVDNDRNSHEIKDDSSFNLFNTSTTRRPKKIFIKMLDRCPDLNPSSFESSISNYLPSIMLSTMSDPSRQSNMNANLNNLERRSNNHRNSNEQRSSNQEPDIERALNIIRSAMGFGNEGDEFASFLDSVGGVF